jgi:putative ABC transport system permease protein
VFRTYLVQVMALAGVGIFVGLVIGAFVPWALTGLLEQYLPFSARVGIDARPLLLAAVYGFLTAFAFAAWPLARAREVPARALFRDLTAPQTKRPRPRDIALTVGAFALLALIAVATADERYFALWFVGGAIAAMVAFLAAAQGIIAVVRRLPRSKHAGLRLALANLHRPGAQTVPVVLSFGLGLSVLVAVTMLQGNIAAQVSDRLPKEAPAFFFIDIQPQQVEPFERLAGGVPGVSEVEKVPSLRGRIVKVNGTDADKIDVAPNAAWALRGDRGLTYAPTPPQGTEIVAGEWWPADYSGPPLISMDAEIAAGIGVGLGDKLTINVLGREIEAEIASLRQIDWTTLGINFVILFAPGALEGAPHTFIATAKAEPAAELPLQKAVTDAFANVTAIRIRDALEAVNTILGNIGLAVRATAGVTLLAGLFVLAGAVAASHQRRVYDSVVLKVLGATRRRVLAVHLTEYAILGGVVTLLALIIGTTAAYAVVTQVLEAPWVWLPGTAFGTAALSLGLTFSLGLAGTWAALSQKPAPLLRNE